MDKLRNQYGRVAIVYSPGYGAGWSTWNPERFREILCMDREIAQAVIAQDWDRVEALARAKCVGEDAQFLYLSPRKLRVMWLNPGERFEINEYDGNETVRVHSLNQFMLA